MHARARDARIGIKLPGDPRAHFSRAPLRHLTRLGQFIGLYAAAAFCLQLCELAPSPWRLFVMFPFYLVAAAALHGISLFTHEGVHGTLFLHPLGNRLLASACAWPVLQNFAAIPLLALVRGSFRERIWIIAELLVVATAGAFVSRVVPWRWLLHGWLVPMLVVNVIVNVRGMTQHTLLPEPGHALRGSRTILARPLVAFFLCNENFHLEHHLYPGVPWYNLPRLHVALREALISARAPFIPSYWQFVREFVAFSSRPKRAGTLAGRDS
jgi:fatty acid desaturase